MKQRVFTEVSSVKALRLIDVGMACQKVYQQDRDDAEVTVSHGTLTFFPPFQCDAKTMLQV